MSNVKSETSKNRITFDISRFTLLNSEPNVQVCDATKAESYSIRWAHKKI